MAPKLYYSELSPPSRSVLLTAKALGLELDLKPIDLASGEHLSPEFLKINPQHTVPTLDDNGFILWDSHAINAYLVGKYGKTDSLYPKDLKKRGLVDQRLHFNSGSFQPKFGGIIQAIRRGETKIPEETINGLKQSYDLLESILGHKAYFAGVNLTIADLSLGAALSSSIPFVPFDKEKHSHLITWFKSIQALPYYQKANQEGCDKLVGFIKSKLA